MTGFGIATIVGWDLDALAALGTDLATHSTDLRRCFADFRGSTDLSDVWRGAAADAATQHANTLAHDLYELSDAIGLMSRQLTRRHADLVQARDTIVKNVGIARDNDLLVADDGSVSVGPPQPHEPRNAGDTSELLSEASRISSILKGAIGDAAAADIDLARALHDALPTVAARAADQDNVVQAVDYTGQPNAEDPFLSDATFLGPVYPKPGDPDFATYWDTLTTEERVVAARNWGGLPPGFEPFEGVQGGQLPSWAQAYNLAHGTGPDGGTVRPGYGYLGGGSLTGPDGGQWPIVSPYYSDGKHVYLSDTGTPRADGGINDLDGNDPGWHTVESYVGPGQFGTVSQSTKLIIFGENLTGQELEVNPVDSKDVGISGDGQPVYQGGADHAEAKLPADKPYWDAKPPDRHDPSDPRPPEPPFNPTEAALGANALGLQGADGALQAHAAGEHGEREYQVSYQVNDDGRVRAVVNTYTSGPNHDGGGVNVGGFATSFPDGKDGAASEVPIDVRHNGPVQPASMRADVHYLGDPNRNGGTLTNTQILRENLDR